jgi:predicted ABC-type exoprotein transport system permease subunit
MDYFLLFLTDGILGYLLQGIGYLLGVCAFARHKIVAGEFMVMSVLYALAAFGIRQITMISFGYHTVLIMIAFILLAVCIMKTPVFMTVVGILASSIAILLSELLNITILGAIFGYDRAMAIFASNGTIADDIYKALAGVPTNLILIIIMFICYRIRTKLKKENKPNDKAITDNSAQNR